MITLALWLLTAGVPLVAPGELGPRVTLLGELPLKDALDRLGEQTNRLFTPRAMAPEQLDETVRLELDGATLAEALGRLETVTGARVRRRTRLTYTLDGEQPPVARIGQLVGQFRVWLASLRYSFSSYLYLYEPPRSYARGYITPELIVEAPSDADALWVKSLGPPLAVAADGTRLTPYYDPETVRLPDAEEPRFWRQGQYLNAPGPDARHLRELTLELTWRADVRELRFEFPLNLAEAQLQTVAGYDLSLPELEPAFDWLRGVQLQFAGPLPEGLEADELRRLLGRAQWTEPRLWTVDGRSLLVEPRVDNLQVEDDLLTASIRLRSFATTRRRALDRLELLLYLPEGTGATETVTFRQVPVPVRSDDPDL